MSMGCFRASSTQLDWVHKNACPHLAGSGRRPRHAVQMRLDRRDEAVQELGHLPVLQDDRRNGVLWSQSFQHLRLAHKRYDDWGQRQEQGQGQGPRLGVGPASGSRVLRSLISTQSYANQYECNDKAGVSS